MEVERRAAPSEAEFRAHYLTRRHPVVLRGLDEWPATWSFAELARRHGRRTVPVAVTHNKTLRADARGGVAYTTITLADYIARLDGSEHPGLYLTTSLDRFLPELLDEAKVPPYCRAARWRRSRMWMGAGGTVSPLHRDIAHNLIVQLAGKKRFWLYPPRAKMAPYPLWTGLGNFSRIDPESDDTPRHEVILEPGEVLFLPSMWWHHARALERSLSVNFWWAEGWLSLLARAAESWKRLLRLDDMKLEVC